jgi:hypothetical protein
VPDGATLLGVSLNAHKEVIVTALTLLLYSLGDALDKPIFKRLYPTWLDENRDPKSSQVLRSFERVFAGRGLGRTKVEP